MITDATATTHRFKGLPRCGEGPSLRQGALPEATLGSANAKGVCSLHRQIQRRRRSAPFPEHTMLFTQRPGSMEFSEVRLSPDPTRPSTRPTETSTPEP